MRFCAHKNPFRCMSLHVGYRAHKRANVQVENKNIFTVNKIYKARLREIHIITIRL